VKWRDKYGGEGVKEEKKGGRMKRKKTFKHRRKRINDKVKQKVTEEEKVKEKGEREGEKEEERERESGRERERKGKGEVGTNNTIRKKGKAKDMKEKKA
jgi:hypothetical protein